MLVFEKSRAGRGMSMLPACDVEIKKPGEKDAKSFTFRKCLRMTFPDTIQNWQRNPMESMMDSIHLDLVR